MRGLDPRICRVKEDGRIKSGHDVVGGVKLDSDVRRMTMEGRVMRDNPCICRLSETAVFAAVTMTCA